MFIKCEKCSRVYEVSDEKVAAQAPHFFKCTACGNVFDAPFEPPETESPPNVLPLADIFTPLPPEETQDLPTQTDLTATTESDALFETPDKGTVFEPVLVKKFQERRLFIGGIAFIFTVCALLYLFYVGRFYFTRKLPLTEPLYEKAGISTDILGEGLAFENTLFDLEPTQSGYRLHVQTKLVNTMGFEQTIPQIIVLLKDDYGLELQREYVLLEQEKITAGEKIPLTSIMEQLHPNASKIEITFERNLQ